MSKNPTTITYDGKVIATFGAGQTATLKIPREMNAF